MRSLWIILSIFGIQIGSCYAIGQNIEGSNMGWFEARKRCIEERNTDIFDPSKTRLLEHSHVLDDEYYWVGGFETSQWIWTDDTPLFTNIGLCDVPSHLDDDYKEVLPYNSVLQCYRRCNKYRIGLIGTSCYCLDHIDRSTCSKERGNITTCFGNPVDQCGTESSMSVYRVDVPFKLDRDANYQCAYSKSRYYGYYYIELHPYDCGKSLHSICVKEANKNGCHNGLCVSSHTASWTSSNQSCSLAKFSFSRKNDFIAIQNYSLLYTYLYWIGLHKQRSRHWVDGKTEQLDFENSNHELNCLALMKTDGRWSEHWIPCSESHQSLCSSEEHSETLDTTLDTPSSTGIYVGVSVACLLLLAVIGIALVLKRKGLICFKRKEENKTIAMENTAYMYPNNHQIQTTNLQRPDIVDQKVSSEEHDYYNITTALPKSIGDESNHYDHLGADEENYDTAGFHRVDNGVDNTYDHTEPHDDAQKFMVDNEHDTYNHTGSQLGSNEMVDKAHDTYNHTGPRGGSNLMVYKEHDTHNQTEINHVVTVHKGLSTENVETYNHLNCSGSDKGALDAGQCYSHLMADADSDYNTTRPVVDNCTNETYSRVSPTGESQGTEC